MIYKTEYIHNGFNIVVDENLKPVPKMVLNPELDLCPEFRKKQQAWLNDFFGFEQPCYLADHPVEYGFRSTQKVMITNEKGLAILKGLTL